jgi:transglutaminase-like putative cysteine protease
VTTYVIRHRTTYEYRQDVVYSRLVAHLAPRATPRQSPLAYDVRVEPVPVHHVERADFFGNRTDWFVVEQPHDRLEVAAESHVAVGPAPSLDPSAGPGWETVRRACETLSEPAAVDAMQYAFDTQLTAGNDDILAYARTSFSPGRSVLASLLELNSRIHADFTYDKDATDASTAVERAFKLRAGVCQDFAHAGIACLRAMGLPARYISGYLLTQAPAGRERLVGADASHAWFAAWVPPFGWIDFDPTNDMLPSTEHITVAWGRDYADVAPVHGIITGGSEHEVDVGVDVTPL